jgi:hypothetical protein
MRKALAVGTVLLATSAVLGGTVFRQQVADAANLMSVFVTNDSAHPVPVREQNTDANGNIKVHEQGTANVSVQGTPGVTIANTTVPVHEQGTAAVRPSEDEVGITSLFQNSQGGNCGGVLYSVPSGQELIVQYLSAENGHIAGGSNATLVSGSVGATGLDLPLVFQPQGSHAFIASQQVHFVFPSGTHVQFFGAEDDSTCGFEVSMGGYLQPSP